MRRVDAQVTADNPIIVWLLRDINLAFVDTLFFVFHSTGWGRCFRPFLFVVSIDLGFLQKYKQISIEIALANAASLYHQNS